MYSRRSRAPNAEYFRQKPGLDTRYRSHVIFGNDTYRLIMRGSDFREIFAPIESNDEAISLCNGDDVAAVKT